jgi:hypothetical protein
MIFIRVSADPAARYFTRSFADIPDHQTVVVALNLESFTEPRIRIV